MEGSGHGVQRSSLPMKGVLDPKPENRDEGDREAGSNRKPADHLRQRHEALTAPLLKRLYCLLLQMSLDSSFYQCNYGDAFSMATWNCWFAVKIMFRDITNLSDALFKELLGQYEQLLMGSDPSTIASKQAGQHSDAFIPLEEFPLLLRCCMVILQFLEFDQSLVLEKCGVLVTILKRICSSDLRLHVPCHKMQKGKSIINFRSSVSHEYMYAPDGSISSTLEVLDGSMCLAEPGSRSPFLCSILEVFVDELVVHQQLRDHFIGVDNVLSAREKAFVSHGGHGDVVLEVISAHFLLSVSDEWAFEKFPHTLFWSHGRDLVIPQLSLTAAMTFLGNPVVTTAPQIFQAHLISMVSRCIGICMAPNHRQLYPLLLSNYMSAFEQSVNLYNRQMLQKGDHPIGVKSGSDWVMEPCVLGDGTHTTFESYVGPVTYAEINLQIDKLGNTCCPYFGNALSRTKSDLVSDSMTYIKENQYVLDETCRDEICSILNCIIERTLSEEIEVHTLHNNGDISQHEIYLLASLLKLMSCSLLQIVWFMRNRASLGCLKTLKDLSLCGEYDFIIGIVSCFGRYHANKPIQKILHDVMETYPARHKVTKLMLMHFAGLLSFSFDRGPEFLWKGCLFMLMTLMNLLIFEEGNLDALKSLLGCMEKPSFPASRAAKIPEGRTYRRSSQVVALNLQKTKMLYTRERCKSLTYDIKSVDTSVSNLAETQDDRSETKENALCIMNVEQHDLWIEEADDTCNGETFLKCFSAPSDYDADLADFIICKRGKDYSSWLKQKERFRTWKFRARAVMLRERKKRSWNYIKGLSSRCQHRR
ncbi:uncharacterized protein LOC131226270 [Magnolia sinica]|uniref:uncharacterized protein LOC131226270 n=1 Tax=Magnolia sinica TaxID=86752 RepID=UPI002658D5F0|nr:uncharacterized protein LOC131226270 [Magnolia sinica]